MIVGFFLVETGLIEKIRNIEIIAWTTNYIWNFTLFLSDKFKLEKNIKKILLYKSAIFIGFFQILSLIPGVSRSGNSYNSSKIIKF